MAERAELKVLDEIHLIELPELEEDVRHARVTPDTLVRYGPWTGDTWTPVAKVAALADALEFPGARFHANLLARRTPWLTLGLVFMLVGAGFLQLTVPYWLGDSWERVVHLLSLGWEPSILDQAVWGAWTSQLVHANIFHLLGNLAVIAYCSFRCERAVGPAGLWLIIASAVAGGAVLVTGFSELPCIGSSIIGFGLWGAQFALGWRYNDWIPQRRRGNYGFGTVILTIPMWVESVTSPDVSLLGHLGGWLGGVAAALFAVPPTAAPRAQAGRAGVVALLVGAIIGVLPFLFTGLSGYWPGLIGLPSEVVTARDPSLHAFVPWRFARNPSMVAGLGGWSASPEINSPLFVTVVRVPHPGVPTIEEMRGFWLQRMGGNVEADRPALAREGWTAFAFHGVDSEGTEWWAQELVQARGWTSARAGWYTERPLTRARMRLQTAILQTVSWDEPEELARQAIAHQRWPDDPDLAYKYGYSLEEVGRVGEAMAVYAKLAARDDGWEYNACRARMRVCAWEPATAGCDAGWRDDWLAKTDPTEDRIWLPAIQWLAADGNCSVARERAQALSLAGEVNDDEIVEALGKCGTGG